MAKVNLLCTINVVMLCHNSNVLIPATTKIAELEIQTIKIEILTIIHPCVLNEILKMFNLSFYHLSNIQGN